MFAQRGERPPFCAVGRLDESVACAGVIDPATILTQVETVPEAVDAYASFDRRDEGWIKTALVTGH
jgi:hypothetical protein